MIKRKLGLALLLYLLAAPFALAQTPAHPTGTFTPGHTLRSTTPSGSPYADGGGAGGSAVFGKNYLTEIGITATGLPFCINDALTNGPYHRFCLGNQGNNARITYDHLNGATAGDILCDINGTRIPCFGGGASGLPAVASTAALAALASTYSEAVVRLDTVPGNGSPPTIYLSTSSPCALGAGNGDGGVQVKTSDGLCWVAALSGQGVDPRVWGAIGTADDTPLFRLIDTAMGDASWPATAGKIIQMPAATANLCTWRAVNIGGISGANRDLSVINLCAAGTTADLLVVYQGAGPFEAHDLTFQCPLSDPVTRARPAGATGLDIGNALPQLIQSRDIRIRHVKTIGCGNGIVVVGAETVWMDDIYNDRPWGFGWIVTDAGDKAAIHTRQVRVHNTYGRNPGQYCGSAPADGSNTTLAAEKYEFLDIGCDGAGFVNQKFCFDLPTTTSVHEVVVRGWGRNCFLGGLESKLTHTNAGETPPGNHNIKIDFTYFSNYDNGNGIQASFEGAGNAGDYSDVSLKGFTSYTAPAPRLASTSYQPGDVWTANSKTYKVVTPGVSDSGGGPSTTGNGITDGTLQVDYLQATPAGRAQDIGCLAVEGILRFSADLTCYNTSFAVVAFLRGGTGAALSGADIHMTAVNISRACWSDSGSFSGNVVGLRLSGSCSAFGDAGYNMFTFGANASNQYNGLEIVGGSWRQSSTSTAIGCIFNAGAAVFNLKISGGAYFECANRMMYLLGPSNIDVSGGGLWNLTGASPQAAITASGAAATGTIEVTDPVRIKTTADPTTQANYSWVNFSSATEKVYGRFIRGWTTNAIDVLPTDRCTTGDVLLSQTAGIASQPDQGFYCAVLAGTTWAAIGVVTSPFVTLQKLGADPLTAPGAGLARIYAVQGAGSTATIRMQAGTSTTPVDIVVNVGTGF